MFIFAIFGDTVQQFQRQQEEFRRHQQQQDHLRRQQQDNLRRQEQQRQQALLRNVQRSSAIDGGSTVVHVAPGFTFEMSGINISPGTIQINGVELTGNGIQQPNEEPAGVGIPGDQAAPSGQPQVCVLIAMAYVCILKTLGIRHLGGSASVCLSKQ